MRALVFGEILWDIIEGTPYLGGAPFNFAAHLARMGAQATVVSAVGDDDLGKQAIKQAEGYGIDTTCIGVDPERPTGTVDVTVDESGAPDYVIHEGVAWDSLECSAEQLRDISRTAWDVVYLGTLAQRTESNRRLLHRILREIRRRHVFYDVNLRQSYHAAEWIERSLLSSTIVKVNEEEASVLSDMCFSSALPLERTASRLAEAYGLDVVIVTRGAAGAYVWSRDASHYTECRDVDVVDTVGAGDSFGAAFVHGYLGGAGVATSAKLAAEVADFVVTRSGAIPEYPPELEERIAAAG